MDRPNSSGISLIPPGISGLSPEEITRHQNSSTYVGPDDPWHGPRMGTFSMPNRRPPGKRHGAPPPSMQPNDETWSTTSVDQAHHTLSMNAAATAGHSPSNGSAGDSTSTQHGMTSLDMLDAKALFEKLVQDMPLHEGDSARYQAYAGLIRMKTKSLELDIAIAKQKEREAELELARFKAMVHPLDRNPDQPTEPDWVAPEVDTNLQTSDAPVQAINPPLEQAMDYIAGTYPFDPRLTMNTGTDRHAVQYPSNTELSVAASADSPLTAFDIDSLLQSANLDTLLSWLPSMDTQPGMDLPTTLDPSQLHLSVSEPNFMPPVQASAGSSEYHSIEPPSSNGVKRRLSSPGDAVSDITTATATGKKPKKAGKRGTTEESANCISCSNPLLRCMIRAVAEDLPKSLDLDLHCRSCRPVECLTSPPDVTAGSHIVTLDVRKRLRISMEIEDEERHAVDRRVFCDVCQRLVASGRILDSGSAELVLSMAEIVCSSCDGKYQRCTDVSVSHPRMRRLGGPQLITY